MKTLVSLHKWTPYLKVHRFYIEHPWIVCRDFFINSFICLSTSITRVSYAVQSSRGFQHLSNLALLNICYYLNHQDFFLNLQISSICISDIFGSNFNCTRVHAKPWTLEFIKSQVTPLFWNSRRPNFLKEASGQIIWTDWLFCIVV